MKRASKGFRLTGRVLLAVGTILVAGAVMMLLYAVFGGWDFSGVVPPPGFIPGGPGADLTAVRTSGLIWASLAMILALVGLAFIFGRLNVFVGEIVDKIAKFVRMDVLEVEVLLVMLIWGLASVILLLVSPVIAILTVSFLVLNVICFLLAWLFARKKRL
jgi:hypothetical protein